MKRILLIFLISLLSLSAFSQQQRLIVFGGTSWFPFDPISGRYQSGSLSHVASYVDAWREELGEENVFVSASPRFFETTPKGYKAYLSLSDSGMLKDIFKYFDLQPLDQHRFAYDKLLVDSLRGSNILVVDRWNFFGDTTLKSKVVDISDFPVSKQFMDCMDKSILRLKELMSSPIAELDTVYSTKDCYFGPSRLSGLFHSFQRDVSGAELSLFAPPRFDQSWEKGGLYVKEVYDMLGYDNELSVVTVNGTMLKEYLEEIYANRYYVMKKPTDDLVRVKTPYFYHESLSGAEYWVNVTKPKGKRIENCSIKPEKHYTLTVNSFRAKWFVEHGCEVRNIGEYRLLFLKWLKEEPRINFETVEQWRIIPERWVDDAVKREQVTIFKK